MLNQLQKTKFFSRQLSLRKPKEKPTGDVVRVYQLLTNNYKVKVVGKVTLVPCCFHQEDTPSLALYPSTSSYFCYGCQKHGDIFNLVEEVLGCSFKEAIKYVEDNQ